MQVNNPEMSQSLQHQQDVDTLKISELSHNGQNDTQQSYQSLSLSPLITSTVPDHSRALNQDPPPSLIVDKDIETWPNTLRQVICSFTDLSPDLYKHNFARLTELHENISVTRKGMLLSTMEEARANIAHNFNTEQPIYYEYQHGNKCSRVMDSEGKQRQGSPLDRTKRVDLLTKIGDSVSVSRGNIILLMRPDQSWCLAIIERLHCDRVEQEVEEIKVFNGGRHVQMDLVLANGRDLDDARLFLLPHCFTKVLEQPVCVTQSSLNCKHHCNLSHFQTLVDEPSQCSGYYRLTEQDRHVEPIANMLGACVYDCTVTTAASAPATDEYPLPSLVVVDHDYQEIPVPEQHSYCNRPEILFIDNLVQYLAKELPTMPDDQALPTVGILSPYAEQVRLLTLKMNRLKYIDTSLQTKLHVEVRSVSEAQGAQYDYCILSTVRCNAACSLDVDDRLVVAGLTCARKNLVILGNTATASNSPALRRVFQYARDYHPESYCDRQHLEQWAEFGQLCRWQQCVHRVFDFIPDEEATRKRYGKKVAAAKRKRSEEQMGEEVGEEEEEEGEEVVST